MSNTTATVNYIEPDFIRYCQDTSKPEKTTSGWGPVSGYGGKIPTRWLVGCKDGRWRRVYAICYSNCASYYIIVKGQTMFIRDSDLH